MVHVEAAVEVPVDPDTLWQAIGSFQGIGDWHPWLAQVAGDGERPGAVRTATGSDGTRQVERLEDADPARHRYGYTMVSTPMPVRDYVAELAVSRSAEGTSTVRWAADFETTSSDEEERAVEMVRQFLDAGLASLEQRFGQPDGQ